MSLIDEHYDEIVELHHREPDLTERELGAACGMTGGFVSDVLTQFYAACRAETDARRLEALPDSSKTIMRRELGDWANSDARRAA